jgi:hypothetical protein
MTGTVQRKGGTALLPDWQHSLCHAEVEMLCDLACPRHVNTDPGVASPLTARTRPARGTDLEARTGPPRDPRAGLA